MVRTARYILTRVVIGLLIILGVTLAKKASAADYLVFSDGSAINNGQRFPAGYFPSSDLPMRSISNGPMTATASPGGPTISGSRNYPIPARGSAPAARVPIPEVVKFPRGTMASAVRSLAKLQPLIFVGLTAYDYFKDDGLKYDSAAPQWTKDTEVCNQPACVWSAPFNAVQYQASTPLQACTLRNEARRLSTNGSVVSTVTTVVQETATSFICRRADTLSDGRTFPPVNDGAATRTGTTSIQPVPATDANLEDAWRNAFNGTENTATEAAALQKIIDLDVPFPGLGSAPTTSTLPAPVTQAMGTTTQTITNADGSTTTRTTTREATTTFINNTTTNNRTLEKEVITTRTVETITIRDNGTLVSTETTNPPTPTTAPEQQPTPEPPAPTGAFKGPGGSARTFGASVTHIKTSWNTSPAMAKLNGLSIPSGGTCPEPAIDMPYLNTAITMNAHCQVAESIRSPLRAVFLALWVIVGIGTFLRP